MTLGPPHIRSSATVPKIYWSVVFSLLPAILAVSILAGWNALRILGCSVSAAMLGEVLGKKIFSRAPALHDGTSTLIGLLFALLCPREIGSGAVITGSFLAVFLGKEWFGGTGQYPFHPALVGQAMTFIFFHEQATLSSLRIVPFPSLDALLIGFKGSVLADIYPMTILAGALLLIFKKIIYGETPFIFLMTLAILSRAIGVDVGRALFSGGIFFAAFYLVTDFSTTPLSRPGCWMSAFLSAVLIFLMQNTLHSVYVTTFALLVVNALTPWLDLRYRPRHAKGIP